MGKTCIRAECGNPPLARGLCSADYQQAKAAGTLNEIAPTPFKDCQQCGRPIPPGRRWGARFCSTQCKDDFSDDEKHAELVRYRAARVRLCGWCREPLSAEARSGSKFCSDGCKDDWNNHQKALSAQRAKQAARQPCEACGRPIPDSRRADAVYCSEDCKNSGDGSGHLRVRQGQVEYNRQYKYGLTPDGFGALLASQGGVCAICGSAEWGGKEGQPHVDHDHVSLRTRGILTRGCNNGLGNFGDDPLRLIAAARYLLTALASPDGIGRRCEDPALLAGALTALTGDDPALRHAAGALLEAPSRTAATGLSWSSSPEVIAVPAGGAGGAGPPNPGSPPHAASREPSPGCVMSLENEPGTAPDTGAALIAAANEFVRGVQLTGRAPDPVPLDVAAVAHIAASRPHDVVLAEYSAMLDARDAGEPCDVAASGELAQELGLLRLAKASVDGHPPGLPHAVSTGR